MLVPGVPLNLQRFLEHLQRLVRLTAIHVKHAKIDQRVARFFLGADLLSDLQSFVVGRQSGVRFSKLQLHLSNFHQTGRDPALLPETLVDGHRILIIAQRLSRLIHQFVGDAGRLQDEGLLLLVV